MFKKICNDFLEKETQEIYMSFNCARNQWSCLVIWNSMLTYSQIERNLLQMNPENPASNWQVLSPPVLDGHTAALLSFSTRGNSSPWHLLRHLHCFQWSWAELSWADFELIFQRQNICWKLEGPLNGKLLSLRGSITHLHVETWSFSSKVFQV